MTGIRIAYSVVPILGTLLAIWVMRGYDITEQRANEIREELERRRSAKTGAASEEPARTATA